MKYRISVEKLVQPSAYDPLSKLMMYDEWNTVFYQTFDNDKVNEVIAAVASAANKVQNESTKKN